MLKRIVILLSLVLLLFPLRVTSCSAGEYQITEEELTESSQNLQQIRIQVNQLQTDLEQSNKELTIALKASEESKVEISQLKTQLQQSLSVTKQTKTDSLQLTNSLQETNKLMTEYAKEVKQEIRKLTWQRDGALIVIAYLATKKS